LHRKRGGNAPCATGAVLSLRSHRSAPFLLLTAPLILFLCVFYAYPVVAMLMDSVHPPGWTVAEFGALAGSHVFWRVMQVTGEISLIVTVACLVLAWPLAYGMARLPAARANLLMVLVLVPFWTSILVRTYAWMALLGRRGIINNLLLWLGVVDRPLTLLNTRFSVCLAMVHVLLPFMVLPIYATLRGLDWRLVRAADSLGATPWGTLRQIVLPLSLPGTAAGVIFVFVLAIGFYITPVLVGGPSDVMISILINDQVGILNWPAASAMAAVLLAVVLVILGVFARVVGVERIVRGTT
jgi:putative spermidine/putrescine transport system permease protein